MKYLCLLSILCFQTMLANEVIQCPNCQTSIELEPIKAREVPGAGWYCDNCGQFQCHGTKCWWCNYPRE